MSTSTRNIRQISAMRASAVLAVFVMAIVSSCGDGDRRRTNSASPPARATALATPNSSLEQVLDELVSRATNATKHDLLARSNCLGEASVRAEEALLWNVQCTLSDGQAAIFFVSDDLSNVVPLNPLAQDLLAP